ncbi:MAG TPA: helicase-related protein [Candidatus Sulfotelmatobacter sp.]|nr:helicase-related protein [Candidatus Sulfotelmatobacter sp.]
MSVDEHDPHRAAAAARASLKRAVKRLGWVLVDAATVEVRVERAVTVGSRTIVVRGRVPIDVPAELTPEAAAAAVAPLVDPTVAQFAHAMRRAVGTILTDPDDVTQTRTFDRPSFFSALEEARRFLLDAWRALENRRVDERVEAELGLRFYLEGLGGAERTLEYFVGPTNSGKTHAALELLAAAESGMYLAPLRLLALEVYERLIEWGGRASLVTGEERILEAGARHVSSTVEMVDLTREVEVAVVDEVQLLADEQRGWAWTLAIAAVRAKHVILCGSEDGLRAATRLAERLGTTIAVRRFERKNPLRVVPAAGVSGLQPGDAVIAFSRRAVIEYQQQVVRAGLGSAVIYGSLSPGVRRREAERFRTGAAQVVVATDAIGLGLNLPIRRVVFAAVRKFDGVATRNLTAAEIRQIAGRAGRYGLHEEGLVTALDARDVGLIRRAVEGRAPEAPDGPLWISPTDEHLRRLGAIIGTTRVSRLLDFFRTRVLANDAQLRIADVSAQIDVALALELADGFLALPFETRAVYSRAPVSTRGPSLDVLARWGAAHAREGVVAGDELARLGGRDRLMIDEDRSRLATLYLWLAQRFPDVYVNAHFIAELRDEADAGIQATLRARGSHAPHATVPPPRRTIVRRPPRPSYPKPRRRH